MGTSLFLLFLLSPAVRGLMVARCPEGWKARGGTDQCYRVHSRGSDRTFNDARIYCQARGGDLAYIDTEGLRDWLGQLVAATGDVGQNAYMWVGASNVGGEWKWVETDQLVDQLVLPWEGTGSGDCAALTANSKLIKQDCSQKLKFICHRNIEIPLACDYTSGWEDATNRCYKKSTQSNSWHDSEVECLIEGGHLASIESDAEQQLAHDLALEEHDKVWIGYTEENHAGIFTWADGSNSNITYWHEGQPDLSLNGFGAAVVDNDDPSGLWVVEKVTNDYHYLCEKAVGSCLPGWEEFERSCYYFNTESTDALVWDDAKSTCEAVKAKMVVLESNAEDEFFRTRMPETDTLWIGLSSRPNDGIYWTDGAPMDSRNFTHMTDDDKNAAIASSERQCVHLMEILDTDGVTGMSSWVPGDCTMPRHYACEAEMGAQLNLIPPSSDRYCPDGGWVQNFDFCYYFIADEKTWPAAGTECAKKHTQASLVSIVTWGEQDFIFNNQLAAGWTGLNDRGVTDEWVWSDNAAATIFNWNDGEPNGAEENCAEMFLDTGKWNDLPCSSKRAYACKMPASTSPIGTVTTTTDMPDTSACGFDWTENTVTGECYRVELQEFIFDDARLHCSELYYYEGQSQPDLVSIYSVQEQNFVYNLLAAQHLSQAGVWIGMINDYDVNAWTDGTPTDYYNFEDNEPNSIYMEQCIEMYTSTGKWNDAYCSERLPFICEKKGRNYVGPQPPPRPDVLCPSGWSFWDNHCYYFSSDVADWFTADANCKGMMGSSLTSVTNQDENDFLKEVLTDMRVYGWMGLRDDDNGNDWHWTDGSLFDWTNWGLGEPSNYNGEEHCGELRSYDYYYNGQWNDMTCSTLNNYVCKMSVRTCPDTWAYKDGKCYYVSDTEATRNEGLVKCQEVNTNANLVNIHSEEENQFLMAQLIQNSYSCWMGLQYNGSSWVWADGTTMDYENWNSGEPNAMETELCGEMIDYPNDESNGKWNNLGCEQSRAYGCELYPTHLIGCEEGWQSFGDYCYWYSDADYSSQYVTHHSAKTQCEDLGANLVSIHSSEENDFVFGIIWGWYTNTYIGFTDIGHKGLFTWDDGTTVVFTQVDSFMGTQINSAEVCASITPVSSYGYDWVFTSCSNLNAFVCKKPKEATPLNPVTTGCDEGDYYHETSCYSIPGTASSWENAKADCEIRVQHLAVLGNQFETAFFSALVGELGERTWLGLSGTIAGDGSVTFTWVTGEQLDYSYWDKYEPDPGYGTCVSASGDSDNPGLWAVMSCSDSFQYVCEYERVGYTTQPPPTTKAPSDYCLYGWEHKGQRCYKVISDAAVWGDGEARCELFGAHLTSIADEAEQGLILALSGMEDVVAKYGNVWVGLVMGSETGYEWTDGSATDYVNWAEGQPDSHGGRESCVSADGTTLKLSDSVCLTHLPFICEAPVGTMLTTATEPTKPPLNMCSGGSNWYLYNDHCYKFISSTDEEAETWWGSHKLCRDEGGELVSILSREENYWIESMIYDKAELSMWTGGRAKLGTGYEWIDNEPFVYDNWALGEPNNVNDQEDCIAMYTNNQGYWNDQNCGHTAGRICKRSNGMTNPPIQTTQVPDGHCPESWLHTGTKCVYFITDRLNFGTSRTVCQKLGSKMELASIHSAAEQAYLTAAMVTLKEHMWIGMSYESGFFWVDQTSVTYTNWGPNEPNGGYQREECVEVSSETGHWNDVSCSAEFGGVCMMTQDPNLPDPHTPSTCSSPHQDYTDYNGACYKAVDSPQTWKEAEVTCANEDAHLVSIMTISQDSFVWAMGQQSGFSSLWIGLNNKQKQDTFVWSDGWPTIYTNWGRDEPATNLTNCVALDVTNGAWYTKLCDDTHTFICKYTNETAPTPDPPSTGYCPDNRWKDLNGGYCYLFSNDTKKWNDANLFCLQEMSQLASIHSEEEMKLITLATGGYTEPLWIGLVETSGGGESWSDRTSVNYINWQNGEPNSGEEQCTEVTINSGLWNDADCEVTRYYICKISKIQESTDPPVEITSTSNPDDGGGGPAGISAGGIAGIVIAVLFVMAAVGFVGFTYIRGKSKSARNHGNESFGKMGGGNVEVAGVMDGTDA